MQRVGGQVLRPGPWLRWEEAPGGRAQATPTPAHPEERRPGPSWGLCRPWALAPLGRAAPTCGRAPRPLSGASLSLPGPLGPSQLPAVSNLPPRGRGPLRGLVGSPPQSCHLGGLSGPQSHPEPSGWWLCSVGGTVPCRKPAWAPGRLREEPRAPEGCMSSALASPAPWPLGPWDCFSLEPSEVVCPEFPA